MEFRLIDIFGSRDKIHKKVLQLQTSDPRDVAKYIVKINKRLQKEHYMEMMEKLQRIPSDKFTVTHQKEYDKLIIVINTIRQEVKQYMRNVHRGEMAWSP